MASWESGVIPPEEWLSLINEPAVIRAALPMGALLFEPSNILDGASQLCVMPCMLPLLPFHGLPLGQIFSVTCGAEGLGEALDQMVPGLAAELEFLLHPWCCRWLDLVKATPSAFVTKWVTCDDIRDSLVLQDTAPDPAKLFSLPLFSLDYGLAYKLHRDCILALVCFIYDD
jgi:hypothetical protein